jgi:hypothetical protein
MTSSRPNPLISLAGWHRMDSRGGVDMYRVRGKLNVGASCHNGKWIFSVDPSRWWWIIPLGRVPEAEWWPWVAKAMKHVGLTRYRKIDDVAFGGLSIKYIDISLFNAPGRP